jgi:hypothetical protein
MKLGLTLEEQRVLRKIPESTWVEVTGVCRLLNKELYDLYCHTKYISGNQRMRWLGNVARTGEMICTQGSSWEAWEKEPPVKPKHRWKDMKMDIKKVWWVWTGLIRLWTKSRRPLCTFKKLRVRKIQRQSCLAAGLSFSRKMFHSQLVLQIAIISSTHTPLEKSLRYALNKRLTGPHWWSLTLYKRSLVITAATLITFCNNQK